MSVLYTPDHFSVAELVDRQTFTDRGAKALYLFDSRILIIADLLRERYGPAFVNTWSLNEFVRAAYGVRDESGLRMPYHGSYSKYSQHVHGRALDMLFRDTTAADIRADIVSTDLDLPFKVVLEKDVGWLHIAVSGNYAEWLTVY